MAAYDRGKASVANGEEDMGKMQHSRSTDEVALLKMAPRQLSWKRPGLRSVSRRRAEQCVRDWGSWSSSAVLDAREKGHKVDAGGRKVATLWKEGNEVGIGIGLEIW